MRSFSLITVLPCHGLEDFPTHHQGAQADGLLAGMTSLWHPGILDRAQSLPTWHRPDQIPEDCQSTVILVPSIASSQLPTGLAERVQRQNGLLIQDEMSRDKIVQSVISFLSAESTGVESLARDFFAFAFAYWQVQLMTRQLRYSGHLDHAHVKHVVLAAAAAWSRRDETACRRELQSAFDLLIQERTRYFPVDALFIELLLVAPTTIGSSLTQALECENPLNVLLTGRMAVELTDKNPEALAKIKVRLADASLDVVGGSHDEVRFPLIAIESASDQFRRGRSDFEQRLGQAPRFFARRTAGLTPTLPQLLTDWGFNGAVHASFDQGRFPPPAAGAIEWQGHDGTVIPALSIAPMDANRPDGFARLGVSLGESFDSSHTATALMAHWPLNTSPWFEDLRRTTRYGNVLGRFVTLSEYFSKSSSSARRDRYTADQYRAEFLDVSVSQGVANPISQVIDYWRNQARLSQVGPMDMMISLLSGVPSESLSGQQIHYELKTLQRQNDDSVEAAIVRSESTGNDVSQAIQRLRDLRIERLRDVLIDRSADPTTEHLVVANPSGAPRRIVWETSRPFVPATKDPPVFAADSDSRNGHVVIDVPPFGFAIARAANPRDRKRRSDRSILSGQRLSNEFFEVDVDSSTGGIRSIHRYDRRGNLFSQMLGIRLPPGRRTAAGQNAAYAQPVARSIRATIDDSIVGELIADGDFKVGNDVLGKFQQRIRVCRGVRVIELELTVEPGETWTDDPWRHYSCSRFAWHNESAELFRGILGTRCAIVEPRFEAPQYVEIVDADDRVAILTEGLPYHRRYDYRKLDSVLQVRGETQTRFRMGIAVDVRSAAQAAIDFAQPPIVWEAASEPRVQQSAAWLLRTDCRNVVVTAIEARSPDGFADGVRVRCKETEGRAGQCRIAAARPIRGACRVRLDGATRSELNIIDGAAEIGFVGHEYFQIDLQW